MPASGATAPNIGKAAEKHSHSQQLQHQVTIVGEFTAKPKVQTFIGKRNNDQYNGKECQKNVVNNSAIQVSSTVSILHQGSSEGGKHYAHNRPRNNQKPGNNFIERCIVAHGDHGEHCTN